MANINFVILKKSRYKLSQLSDPILMYYMVIKFDVILDNIKGPSSCILEKILLLSVKNRKKEICKKATQLSLI